MEHRVCWGRLGLIADTTAIRPNQEVCIYVSAWPFSKGEKQRAGDAQAAKGQRAWPPVLVDPTVQLLLLYHLLVVRF